MYDRILNCNLESNFGENVNISCIRIPACHLQMFVPLQLSASVGSDENSNCHTTCVPMRSIFMPITLGIIPSENFQYGLIFTNAIAHNATGRESGNPRELSLSAVRGAGQPEICILRKRSYYTKFVTDPHNLTCVLLNYF